VNYSARISRKREALESGIGHPQCENFFFVSKSSSQTRRLCLELCHVLWFFFSLELELNFLLYVQTFCWVINYFNITDITDSVCH
jgi:hypothetical protein